MSRAVQTGAELCSGTVLDSDYGTQNCSIARALEAVGERWTLLIVRELLRRPRKFAQIQRTLGISKNVLATRLDKLVDIGIVAKVPYTDARDWNEYLLTTKGKDLFPIISALMAWGDSYEAPFGPPAVFEHTCGHAADHRMSCEACGEPVNADTMLAVPGPGFHRTDRLASPRPGNAKDVR